MKVTITKTQIEELTKIELEADSEEFGFCETIYVPNDGEDFPRKPRK